MSFVERRGFGLFQSLILCALIVSVGLVNNDIRKNIVMKEDVQSIFDTVTSQPKANPLQRLTVPASLLSVSDDHTLNLTKDGYYTLDNTNGQKFCVYLKFYGRYDVEQHRMSDGHLNIDSIEEQCKKETLIKLITEERFEVSPFPHHSLNKNTMNDSITFNE